MDPQIRMMLESVYESVEDGKLQQSISHIIVRETNRL